MLSEETPARPIAELTSPATGSATTPVRRDLHQELDARRGQARRQHPRRRDDALSSDGYLLHRLRLCRGNSWVCKMLVKAVLRW